MREITYTAKQAEASARSSIDPVLVTEGYSLIAKEKELSFRQALRYHWRAFLWSMFLSLALVMDGYDGSIINSFFGLPSFLERFGIPNAAGVKSIPTDYQAAFQNVGLPGAFIGLFLCGWGQERFGSRKTYMSGMVACIAIVFLFVFAQSLGMLLGAQAISSACWSLFNTLSAAYAAEICPIQLRGVAASFISMCWGMGGFIASGVNRGALSIPGDWGWRMAYMVQWVWPVPLLIGTYFAPESPWWLVRKGRIEEAKRTLTRNACPGYWDNRNIDAYIAVIQHTDEIEKIEAAKGSFWDLWRGSNLRRTEVEMGVWAMQVLSGTAMTAYAVQFLQSAGMSVTTSFNLNIVITAMNLADHAIGCGIEFGLITRIGRRPLILWGMVILGICLAIIGILGSIPASVGTLAGTGACCAIINLVYHATVGPVTYTVAAEVPASRVRARTVAFGRAFYVICYNATSQLTPRMVSDGIGGWGWKGKAAFFWLGFNVLVTTWAYFRMPETGGFSFADLDVLFANKVPAREFTKVRIIRIEEEESTELDGKDEEAKAEAQHVELR